MFASSRVWRETSREDTRVRRVWENDGYRTSGHRKSPAATRHVLESRCTIVRPGLCEASWRDATLSGWRKDSRISTRGNSVSQNQNLTRFRVRRAYPSKPRVFGIQFEKNNNNNNKRELVNPNDWIEGEILLTFEK